MLRLLAWGYNAGETIRSGPRGGDPGRDILVTINVGDALVFPNGLTSSGSSSTETHYSTIDELGINEAIEPGEDTNFGYTLSPPEAGTYRIYCSPRQSHVKLPEAFLSSSQLRKALVGS